MTNNCKVVVLISGNGSNLQALINEQKEGKLPITINAVISNKPDVYGLKRAKQAKITQEVLDHTKFDSREEFDQQLMHTIDGYEPDLIVLAGFMRILSVEFIQHYKNRILNIHPSLLPKYQGLHTHKRVLEDKESIHGVTVHSVTEELDAGPGIIQAVIPVFPGDDEEDLRLRIQSQEHKIYPRAVNWFASGRLAIEDQQVKLDGKTLPPGGEQIREL